MLPDNVVPVPFLKIWVELVVVSKVNACAYVGFLIPDTARGFPSTATFFFLDFFASLFSLNYIKFSPSLI